MNRLWTKDFVLLTLSTFFVFVNMQMITPCLPVYIKSGIGGNRLIGLSTAAWAIGAVLVRVFAGKILAGERKGRLLWIGILLFLLSTCGYLIAVNSGTLLVVRLVYGFGFGLTTTTFGTLVAHVIPHHRLGEGMGYFGLSTSLAMAIAPVIGLTLLHRAGYPALVWVLIALVFAIASIVPLIRVVHGKRHHASDRFAAGSEARGEQAPAHPDGVALDGGEPPMQVRRVPSLRIEDFYDKVIVLPAFLLLMLSTTYGGIVSFLALYGDSMHMMNVGWFFLMMAGSVVLVRPFSGRLFDAFGHVSVLPAGAISLFVALNVLAASHNTSGLLISAVFYGVGYGTLQPGLQAWMFQRLRPERRGIGSGAFFNAMDIGVALGSVVFGAVASFTGYAMMYRISSLCMVIFMVLYVSATLLGRRANPSTGIA